MKFLTERRLKRVSARLTAAREDLRLTDEHLVHFADIEDDTRIRSIVSDSPMQAQDHAEANSDMVTLARHRHGLVEEITRLERRQDELLDEWNS